MAAVLVADGTLCTVVATRQRIIYFYLFLAMKKPLEIVGVRPLYDVATAVLRYAPSFNMDPSKVRAKPEFSIFPR